MFPLQDWVVLFRLGDWTFVTFGLFAGLGATAAAWVISARQLQAELPAGQLVLWLAVICPVLALVGSRLYALVLLEWQEFRAAPLRTLARTTLAWQGGFVLVTAGVLVLAAWHGIDPLLWIDTFAFGVPLGQAFGRVGCHTYGCCHGRPSDVPWAIRVHNPLSKTVWFAHLQDVPLHPAQLYSAAANVLLASTLAALATAGPLPAGTVAAVYLVLDAVKRFLLELVRNGTVEKTLGLTPYQQFAVVQALAGLGVGALSRSRPPAGFDAGFFDALGGTAAYLPAYLLGGVLFWLLMGVHRGSPGSVSLDR